MAHCPHREELDKIRERLQRKESKANLKQKDNKKSKGKHRALVTTSESPSSESGGDDDEDSEDAYLHEEDTEDEANIAVFDTSDGDSQLGYFPENSSSDEEAWIASNDSGIGMTDDPTVNSKARPIPSLHKYRWYLDTGATSHMTGNKKLFIYLELIKTHRMVKTGSGRLPITGIGIVKLRDARHSFIRFSYVLYVPGLSSNLLSVWALTKTGITGEINHNSIVFKKGKNEVLRAIAENRLYVVNWIAKTVEDHALTAEDTQALLAEDSDMRTGDASEDEMDIVNPTVESNATATINVIDASSNAVAATSTGQSPSLDEAGTGEEQTVTPSGKLISKERQLYNLWHRRFGHFKSSKLRNLHKITNLSIAIPVKSAPEHCEVCDTTKFRKRTNRGLSALESEPLALVYIDICGPLDASFRGNRFFVEVCDNCTRKCWVIPIAGRDYEVVKPALDQWRKDVELESGHKLKAVRTDNAGELLKEVGQWHRESGVALQATVIHSSHQNGPAERAIQLTEEGIRALCKDAKLPLQFWCYAAETICYYRNRIEIPYELSKILNKEISPEELWTGKQPEVNHMRVWGCKVISYVDPDSLPVGTKNRSLADRGREAVFVGYVDKTTKQYWIYAPDMRKVMKTSNLRFYEDTPGGSVDLNLPTATIPLGLPERKPRGRPPGSKNRPKTGTASPTPTSDITTSNSTPQPTGEGLKTTTSSHDGKTATPTTTDATGNDPSVTSVAPPTADPTKADRHRVEFTGKSLLTPSSSRQAQDGSELSTEALDQHGETKTHGTTKREDSAASDMNTNKLLHDQKPSDVQKDETRKNKRLHDDDDRNEGERRYSKRLRGEMADLLINEALIAALVAKDTKKPHNPIPVPKTYRDAVRDPIYGRDWKEAIHREFRELIANGTFREVRKPERANIVSSKWVFAVKYAIDGSIQRFKARLVARGFSQVRGIDFQETFAPTIRIDSLRILLAIAALEDLEAHQFDVNNAFTEAKLREQIFMKPPDGIEIPLDHVWEIKQSLYGLKQAARDWYKLCSKFLKSIGFVAIPSDPCVFIHRDNNMTIGLYVDDLLVLARDAKKIHDFGKQLRQRFKVKYLGEAERILGIRIERDRKRRTIYLDQSAYFKQMLQQMGMANESKFANRIPMTTQIGLTKTKPNDIKVPVRQYQQQMGSVMFPMVYSRPDIAFATGKLAQFMDNPNSSHARSMKTLLRYIRETMDLRIKYGPHKESNNQVIGYSDADYANDKFDRKSVSGMIFMLGGGPISWRSRKQKSVSTSTTEAEYIALSAAAKHAKWISQFLTDIGFPQYIGPKNKYGRHQVRLFGDNTASLTLVEQPQINERSKHIDVAYHSIRDLRERGIIECQYISTDKMLADALTKPLGRVLFTRHRDAMGLVNRGSSDFKEETTTTELAKVEGQQATTAKDS
jgi:hypothetical protein